MNKQWWLDTAEVIDANRLVPRAIMAGYGYAFWRLLEWYMALPEPTNQQSAAFASMVGLAGAVTKFYVETGRRWNGDGK